MTIKEGQGKVSPAAVKVRIRGSDVRQLLRIADDRNKHRQYAQSASAWKKGSASNPALIGLVGEYALQELLTRRLGVAIKIVDDSLNNGDGGVDVVVYGISYQVKTSQRVFKSVLVRRISDNRRLVPHTCQRYVFCAWNEREKDCQVIGWCSRETLRDFGVLERPKVANGKWWNISLDTLHLESADSLIRQIKLDKEASESGSN